AQSLRGERFVEGTYRVYDRDFAVMGDLALAGSDYFGRTPVVSPDGSRVYVMAYSSASLRGGPGTPRVYVFDSSQRMVVTTNLPLLGYFDLAHFPTCNNTEYACNTRATGAISPDGKTLFFLGDAHLVVAPIPQTLNTVQRASLQ
ncbi:PD40 domain-containing protein, partial [Acinetobacter baumannii]|uniref:PD40 domain-containing protein n=1 Tax=Acinetobacter baumannii TaxID=470 RepID=UPI001897E869